MNYYKYTNEEIEYLKNRDPILGTEIDKIGMIEREIEPDIFSALISSIISQQISTKAAVTVKKRFVKLIGSITQENIEKADVKLMQECGMSFRKASYIKDIAKAAVNGIIDFPNLKKLTDEEVIKELTQLKGVGVWTVEMLLLHSLQRPNILSYKDLGIRRGIIKLYELDGLTEKEFELYRDRYSPYCTVASLYLWKISSVDY
ncbi:MAG: DNA-3-methyladenine glycosylase 2 family protein [Tissierellia bacterium]|nr:DNA-3-methyladenine glycosylase 2 family protein [Tissierellia bacterium]MDD4779608.1 DNA-3-methyladenine glycosylase 2 family protein [Tissierellia bacterium]